MQKTTGILTKAGSRNFSLISKLYGSPVVSQRFFQAKNKTQIPLPLFRKQLSILKCIEKKRAKTLSQRRSPLFSIEPQINVENVFFQSLRLGNKFRNLLTYILLITKTL